MKENKPIILIIPSLDEYNNLKLSQKYTKIISKNSAVPIISAYYKNINDIIKYIDGIIFSGGVDPNPIFFDIEPRYCNDITPKRDIFEISLCKKAFKMGIPILGICRGIQIIALTFGGNIYQDIHKENSNKSKHYQNFSGKYPFHSINIRKKSKLYNIIKSEKLYVNSFHHQAIKEVPKKFEISAISDDLIIEAIEYKGNKFIIGVQWHPEQMTKSNYNESIFKKFIYEANEYKRRNKNGF